MALVEVNDFSFAYPADGSARRGGAGDRVFDEVSFEVNEGDFCVLVGSTGSGKTTLLRSAQARAGARRRAHRVYRRCGKKDR